MLGNKIKLNGVLSQDTRGQGVPGGKLDLPHLDKAHVDKPHLQKPKRVY